jgi:hypothetical protein
VRIPLATTIESRDGTLTRDAKVKNGIVETRGEDVPPIVRKRPGLTDLGLVRAGAAQLLYYWFGKVRTVIGDYLDGATGVGQLVVTAWNSADKDADVALSNGDLTITVSAGGFARSVDSLSSGSWAFQTTVATATGTVCVGMANASATFVQLGASHDSIAYNSNSGQITKNSSVLATVATYTAGDVIKVIYDADTPSIKFYKNGTLVYTATGSNVPTGPLYAAAGANSAGAVVHTTNFGVAASGASLSPTSAGEQFSAQDNGANSPESLLMIKNSTQAWVVDTSDVVTQITDVDYPGKYTVTLTSLTRSSTTATATTAADTNFRAGDSVVIAGVNEAGWNGTYTILSTTRSGQTVPAPDPVAITITRSGTTATATSTAGPHGYTNGQSVTIAGAEQTQYNGTKTITWISATQFSFTVTVTSAVTAAPTSPATGTPVITPKTYTGLASSTIGGGVVDIQPQGTDQATISFFAGLTAGVQVTIASCAADAGFVGTHTIASSGTGYSRITYSAAWQGFTTITVRGPAPTISSITTDGAGVATVTTSAAHGFTTGQLVTITGASPWQYNVTDATVTVTGTTTFTYRHPYTSAADASPATPATGTITAQGPASVSGASFTFAVDGTETTPATGTITANSGRTTVPGIAYLNGYFVVMDEQGVLYNSALDDPENWNALEYTSALNEPGAGKAIAKSGNYIAAFKEWSTEFFYDAKNPVGSPLSPVENGFTLVGCASGESVANVDGALMWVAQSKKHKGRSVYAMRGIEQAKVSTPAVERILNADSLATVRAWGARIDGHPCYILTLVGSGVTLVLDASTGIWHEWSTLTIGSSVSVSSITRDGTTATVTCATAHGMSDGDPVTIAGATQTDYNGTFQAAYVSATVFAIEVENSPSTPATGTILAYPYSSSYFKLTHYASANGVDVTLHATDGHLYEIDPDTYQDDGVPVDFFVRTSRLDGGSIRRKKIARISVIGESADDSAMLRFSDDDSATFVSYRRVTLSDTEPNIRRCGAFERRSLEFRHVGNTAPRPEALELLIGE